MALTGIADAQLIPPPMSGGSGGLMPPPPTSGVMGNQLPDVLADLHQTAARLQELRGIVVQRRNDYDVAVQELRQTNKTLGLIFGRLREIMESMSSSGPGEEYAEGVDKPDFSLHTSKPDGPMPGPAPSYR